MLANLWNNIWMERPPQLQVYPDLNGEICKQNHTIQRLNYEILILKEQIENLKAELINQQNDLKMEFEKQKEYFVEGIKQVLLTLENERLNNDTLLIEVEDLRQKNRDLELENQFLKYKHDAKDLNH